MYLCTYLLWYAIHNEIVGSRKYVMKKVNVVKFCADIIITGRVQLVFTDTYITYARIISYSMRVEVRNCRWTLFTFFQLWSYQNSKRLKWFFSSIWQDINFKKILSLVITLISWKLSKQSWTTISNFNTRRIWDEPGINQTCLDQKTIVIIKSQSKILFITTGA